MRRIRVLAASSILVALAGCASGAGPRQGDLVRPAETEPASLLGERSYVACEWLPPVPPPRRPRGPDDRTFTFRVVEDPYLAQGFVILGQDRYGNPVYGPKWAAGWCAPSRGGSALCHHCGRNPCSCAPSDCAPSSCDVPRGKPPVGMAQPIGGSIHVISPGGEHCAGPADVIVEPAGPPDVDSYFRPDAVAR